ncbi:uncharacterized protein [Drosophila kikkawai]|uniref:Uncharacterized protein isoform X1 n=3 Tax=Drosophila kikkawai TaxID=30033 RepID=A0A6P4ILZ6_DROKI|nr:uncharacterized protein LOC108075553 [Drosophila kikkawai]
MKKSWVKYASMCLNILLLSCILLVLYVEPPEPTPVEIRPRKPPEIMSNINSKGLLVNTSQCKMPAMDPLSPTAQYFMKALPSYSCYLTQLLKPRTIRGRNFLYLALSKNKLWKYYGIRRVSEIFCVYTVLERIDDFNNRYVAQTVFGFTRLRKYQEIEPSNATLRVWCWRDRGRLLFLDVFIFLPEPIPPRKGEKVRLEHLKRLSVLILGIDSISHMHYRRYFSKTMNFVDKFPHTEMWGYNRVGENSYPNVLPLLSGQNDTILNGPTGCYGASNPKCFDRCYLLFDFFKAAGYVTMFGEDSALAGTFVYNLSGFQRQPTDFYLRPAMYEIDQETNYPAQGASYISCTAGRSYSQVLDDFKHRLLPHMEARSQDTGFFGFFWQSHGVHDYFWYAQVADVAYEAYLKELQRHQLFRNTFVLLMSDHGLRFGPFTDTFQGMREISLPTVIAIYPRWMVRRFPLAIKNLKTNAHRLMTTHDLHETLKDLANLENLNDEHIRSRTWQLRNDRNVSLFLPIPEERSCSSAEIPEHYCQCYNYVKIPFNLDIVQRAARFVVDSINELLVAYPKCQRLQLSHVEDAYKRDPKQTVTVRLVTEPGGGHYDATVHHDHNISTLQGRITRTDQYKEQSLCIEKSIIQQYCYCL